MQTVNQVTILGHCATDPEAMKNDEYCKLVVTTNSGSKENRKAHHHKISVFDPYKTNFVMQYIKKGMIVFVQGELQYSKLEDALQHKHNLETMTEQLGEKADEENPYTDQITSLRETGIQDISFDTMNELTHLQEHQDFLYKLLTSKDSFIRKKIIDMGTARFLMMRGSVLLKVGFINQKLLQYGGDNDFTLSANRLHKINTYILRDAICRLDDTKTGIKNHNIISTKELLKRW